MYCHSKVFSSFQNFFRCHWWARNWILQLRPQVAVEVKNMKLPCGEILTRVSHATCPLELQRKCNLPAGEKYRSWKWEIHVKNPARAEVANWRRIKIDCYRQNQWVKKVVIQYVAPWGISGSNEPPMGYVLSKLAVLEGWKEKFPAYRGSVVPTHIEEWVGEPDYSSNTCSSPSP